LLIAGLVIGGGIVASSQESLSSKPQYEAEVTCGIRAVYAIARLYGLQESYGRLLHRYISSPAGSSLRDLSHALHELDLHTLTLERATYGDLIDFPSFEIIHTKRNIGDSKPNHFELVLAKTEAQLLILDLPNKPVWVDRADILAKWDGSVVFVDRKPIAYFSVVILGRLKEIVFASVAILLVVIVRRQPFCRMTPINCVHNKVAYCYRVLAQVALLITVIMLSTGAHQVLSRSSLSHAPSIVAQIQAEKWYTFQKKISFEDVQQVIENGGTVIDARYSQDFASGHLPGAINVPVNSTDDTMERILEVIRHDAPVVIYCQSKRCPFSKFVLERMRKSSAVTFLVYSGGWEDWKLKVNSMGQEP
jgi:rhodanese-related sulfurtransferase